MSTRIYVCLVKLGFSPPNPSQKSRSVFLGRSRLIDCFGREIPRYKTDLNSLDSGEEIKFVLHSSNYGMQKL